MTVTQQAMGGIWMLFLVWDDWKSGRGLPHSTTLRAIRKQPEHAPAFWSAAVHRRFRHGGLVRPHYKVSQEQRRDAPGGYKLVISALSFVIFDSIPFC
jgi:hypothetical protein